MFEKCISCLCGKSYPVNKIIFKCVCGKNLEIIFDYEKLKKSIDKETIKSRPFKQLRYKEFYPVQSPVSLQEGGTPLLRSKNIERELGLKFELYFKNETINPTGSFKDRGSSVEVAKAKEFGFEKALCATTGNMGASVSAYSAIANLQCNIFMPKDAKKAKIEQILSYGAKVYHFKKEYTEVAEAAEYVAKNFGVFLLGDYLYRREGTKSIGFELAEQIQADYVFVPIGNGVLLSGTWKGLKEFRQLGFAKSLPKMAGVQAHGSSTITYDIFKRKPIKNSIKGIKHPHTLADAIEVGFPLDGERALEALIESKGFEEIVSDREILHAKELLAKREGLYAEPAGAAALAGLLKSKHRIEKGSKVVCLVTGHGLKAPLIGNKRKPIEAKLGEKLLNKIFGK